MKKQVIIYVLMKDGKPFQLPVEKGTETSHALQSTSALYATASTDKKYVEAMKKILPDLLDMDHEPEFTIAEFSSREEKVRLTLPGPLH